MLAPPNGGVGLATVNQAASYKYFIRYLAVGCVFLGVCFRNSTRALFLIAFRSDLVHIAFVVVEVFTACQRTSRFYRAIFSLGHLSLLSFRLDSGAVLVVRA